MAKISTFTAKFQRPGQEPRFLRDCVIVQNVYLAQVHQRGAGRSWEAGGISAGGDGDTWTEYERYEEYLRPLFDGALVGDKKSELQPLETIEEVFAAGMERYLLRFGQQAGYTITNYDDEQEQKKAAHLARVAARQVPIPVRFGPFGIQIDERLPAQDWEKIKSISHYYSADDDDMEFLDDQGYTGLSRADVRGWYYSEGVIEILTSLGYECRYHGGMIVRNAQEMRAAHQASIDANRAYETRYSEIMKQRGFWKSKIYELANLAGPCTKEQAAHAATCPRRLVLDMTGADIYGGGEWCHVDGEDLYFVTNNGSDGDDWSLNNYATGGAGAICYYLPGEAPLLTVIEAWVESLGDMKHHVSQ